MSETNVGQIKYALLSHIKTLTEATQTEAAVKTDLEQHAARAAAITDKIGELATELALLQADVAKTRVAHEGVAKTAGETGTAIAELGSNDSPLLEQSAGQVAAATNGIRTHTDALGGVDAALTQQIESLNLLSTGVEQQAALLGGLSTGVDQTTALINGGITSAREWIAVAASK